MYVQRYLPHLPAAGEVVIFDRSWYNRAGVERVMGFCTEEQVKRFLELAPLVREGRWSNPGIILLKYWLEVSMEEQTRRLEARIDDGRKIWKLSPMDLEVVQPLVRLLARARRDVRGDRHRPGRRGTWCDSNDKKRARLNLITHLLSKIPYKKVPRDKVKLPKRQKRARLPRAGLSVQVRPREVLSGDRKRDGGRSVGKRRLDLPLKNGRHVTVRTVRPDDRDELQAALRRSRRESRYARFMSPLRELSPRMLDQGNAARAGPRAATGGGRA